ESDRAGARRRTGARAGAASAANRRGESPIPESPEAAAPGWEAAARAVFATGLDYGARNRRAGWGSGQRIQVAMANLLPYLEIEDRPRALTAGLSAVARECDGQPARFAVDPLPGPAPEPGTLAGWFRRFVEVRESEAAERCV